MNTFKIKRIRSSRTKIILFGNFFHCRVLFYFILFTYFFFFSFKVVWYTLTIQSYKWDLIQNLSLIRRCYIHTTIVQIIWFVTFTHIHTTFHTFLLKKNCVKSLFKDFIDKNYLRQSTVSLKW